MFFSQVSINEGEVALGRFFLVECGVDDGKFHGSSLTRKINLFCLSVFHLSTMSAFGFASFLKSTVS